MSSYYTFDDVTLVPTYSEHRSRESINTSQTLGKLSLRVPILSANMDTVTEHAMAEAMWRAGGAGVLHRFMSVEKNVDEYLAVVKSGADAFVSIGVKESDHERARALFAAGARFFVVDIAHGHSILMQETLSRLRNQFDDRIFIVAGNVATARGVSDIASWGADCAKVGIGGGSVCKTRVVTGHGVPMFSCIRDCSSAALNSGIKIIADGGIRSSGDIVKAFAAGADFVMIGSLLAGAPETPGEFVVDNSSVWKTYRGMASPEAFEDHFSDRNTMPAPEGVSTRVYRKNTTASIIEELAGGIRSGMSYCNARSIIDIRQRAQWIIQTTNGCHEGTAHLGR